MIIQNQSQEPIRVSIHSCSIIIIHICIQAAIWYALDNYQYQDAVFLSERLHAESKCQRIYVYRDASTCTHTCKYQQSFRYFVELYQNRY